jgi:hypothetical protein
VNTKPQRTLPQPQGKLIAFYNSCMSEIEVRDPRYPIGDFRRPESITAEDRRFAIVTIAEMPEMLREAVRGFDEEQMDTPYREGGWTVRQLVHHVADSHMTAFHRMRRALTEEVPLLPGYDEAAFALLHDSTAPVEWSLDLIEGLHARWVMMLQALTEEQWQRGFTRDGRGSSTIEAMLMIYSWHSLHHVAHVTRLRAQKGW